VAGVPSGSTPLFGLDGSPSSDSAEDGGPEGTPAALGAPAAAQQHKELLMKGPQPSPTSGNANLRSPLVGASIHLPKGPVLHTQYRSKLLMFIAVYIVKF
jgi:hypothetical protein